MKNPSSHEFEYRVINPRVIKFDESYQRPLDMHRVERIVKEWDGNLFNEPKVSLRDGVYYCFNGQHSVVAWRKKFGDKPVMCKVFKGMTWLDECEAFIAQNGLSKDPTTNEKLGAAYNAKRPDVVEMVNGAAAAGYKVSFRRCKSSITIAAVSAIHKAYKRLGYAAYVDMLTVIHEAWPNSEEAIEARMINAFTEFFARYAGEFTAKNLLASISRTSPKRLIQQASANTTREVARQIVRAYNSKRKSQYRLEDKF